jgi:hypothetical protein
MLILLSISTTYRGWFQAGGVVSGTDLRLSVMSLYQAKVFSSEKDSYILLYWTKMRPRNS